jgi:tetratricopeptide (TPR) repeat protein
MKSLRTIIIMAAVAAMVALTLTASGCAFINKVIAKDKLNQGAIAFNQGKYKEALDFIRRATQLDPDNPNGWLYYGAALIKTYNDLPPEEQKKQQDEAINAYNTALEKANNLKLEKDRCFIRDNAIGYLAKIYEDKGDQNARREWMLRRAEGECAKDDVKAATFYSIGVTFWKCAYDETQRYADKEKMNSDPFHFRNIYTADDKKKHEECTNQGLSYIEKALAVNPNYADALSYKSLLLREKQKTTSNEADRKKYADEAEKIAKRVVELNKQQAAQAPQG